ncbi:MAG: peptide synthase, partial [Candidatus Sericytochromatia bacterium]
GPAGAQTPVVCVELEKGTTGMIGYDVQERIKGELKLIGSHYPHTQRIEHFLFHPAFPVDIRHNAKIFREKLVPWAEGWLK